jgi:DNA-binding transcriptional LysR family regulator
MLDFNDFFYFVQVVDRAGFTAAGRTLRIPKSTLSHRIQQLEANLGVRLLNRTSRRFGMTDAGEEFYRHAVLMLREAELAEPAIRHRLNEPKGTVRCTAAVATMQFAMRDIVPDFPSAIRRSMSLRMRLTRMSISSARITTLRSEPIQTHFRIRRWCNGR